MDDQQPEADMDFQWKLWDRALRSGSLGWDQLDHVAAGDPDPTSGPGTGNGHRMCRFEWADESSQALILSWSCTRELGHQGQHLAGTGEVVAAAHANFLPAAKAASISA